MNPRIIGGLRDKIEQVTVDELCLFLHFSGWMANFMSDSVRRAVALESILERVHKVSEKRTKRSTRGITLQNLSWGPAEVNSFHSLQKSILNTGRLANLDLKRVVSV